MRLRALSPLLLVLALSSLGGLSAGVVPQAPASHLALRHNGGSGGSDGGGNGDHHGDGKWDGGKEGEGDDKHDGWGGGHGGDGGDGGRGDHDGHGDHGGHGDHDGHGDHGGHGDHDGHGDHGGHGDSSCPGSPCPCPSGPDDGSVNKTVTDILNNPNVVTDLNLPDTVNHDTLVDLVSSNTIPAINITAPLLDGKLPALLNASNPATNYGGITSAGTNGTNEPEQGTNRNAAMFGPRVVALSLNLNLTGGIDYNVRRVTAGANPDVPLPNPDNALRCEYEYENVLGGNGTTPKGALWALEDYVNLVAADVKQGGIGDCGMGAAIMALADGGWTPYIKNMFVKLWNSTPPYDKTMAAIFKKDGNTYPVLIDDTLPVLQNANPNCWPYPGYQPVNDAAEPGPDGSYPPTPIFFMPLFEKAFAKFLDFVPEWRATPAGYTGYAGIEGVNPHYVLAAITGGKPKATLRTRPGFDGPIIVALITCMRGLAPCVIGTTNSVTLDGLGTENELGSIWLNPGGDEATPPGYTPGQTSGLLASDSPQSEITYSIVDFDQVVHTPDGDRSTALTMVGYHAYAFAWQRSTRLPLTSLEETRLRFLNPWGRNPSQWPGGGGGGRGAFDDPSEISYSFRTFAQTVVGVYTVEEMPPL